MKKKLTKEDKLSLVVTAAIFLLGIIVLVSCTKIDQTELDGKPIKRPVNIVVVKE